MMTSSDNLVATMRENYNAVLQFLVAKQHGKRMDDYLFRRGYSNIAVYGMNDIGNAVIRELMDSDLVKIEYAIDQGNPKLYFDVDCYRLDGIPKNRRVDLVIVTLTHLYDQVKKDIEKYYICPVISVTDIVYEMDMDD